MTGNAVDVLVVGAGPVGLTMAAALTRHGLTCRIIDKAAVPSDKSKALAVWCRTMELLDGLDLAETFVRTGLKLTGGSIFADGQRLVHLALTSDESPYGFPLMIPQNETERLLTEHLAQLGVTIQREVELVAFQEQANVVACTLRHAAGREESFEVPWVIGCDGAHSTVRHTLGLEFTGHAEPNDWLLADLHIAGPLAPNEVSVFWHETGILAFFPMDRDRFRIIADVGIASSRAAGAEVTLAEVQALVVRRGPGGLVLSDPNWLANFRINERKVSEYRRGRVMLAGDAAHIHSPAGGQGMNTGMQDAFNLAWKLALVHAGQGQVESLLQSYTLERSAVGDQVLKNAERFTNLSTLRSPASQWLRNHIAPILGSFQFFQDKIRSEWFELSINYRHSPLSAQNWPWGRGGLAAGDRMCDAPLTSAADGRQTTLFRAMRGPLHTLLLLPASDDRDAISNLESIAAAAARDFPDILSPHVILKADATWVAGVEPSSTPAIRGRASLDPSHPNRFQTNQGVPWWLDTEGRLDQKLNADGPTLVLVRPDGYIGFRSQPADADALTNYLSSYLTVRR